MSTRLSDTPKTPRFNALCEWLLWLEHLHPVEIDLGLERVNKVAIRLGFGALMSKAPDDNVHLKQANRLGQRPTIVSVAGTNGKGSCVAALQALLLGRSQTVGSYTSPHLLAFNERIKIDGTPVSDELLCRAFSIIDEARGDLSLTYFEFATLAAFVVFEQAGVDYWILEVGLGGRLDAVNCVWADIAIVTSIALDHEAWLGNSREAIGEEKAGILRREAMFICGDTAPPLSLCSKSKQLKTRSYFIGTEFGVATEHGSVQLFCSEGGDHVKHKCKQMPCLPLASLVTACQAFLLLGFSAPTVLEWSTLETLTLIGRLSRHMRPDGQEYLLDVAHNGAASELLVERLQGLVLGGNLSAIVAVMADKNLVEVFKPLVPVIADWNLVCLKGNTRAAGIEEMIVALKQLNVASDKVRCFGSVAEAMRFLGIARDESSEQIFPVLVFGSFFTVADALAEIERKI